MPQHILFISDHGDPLAVLGGDQAGGQNNYVRQLALALDDRGHTVDVFTHWADSQAPQIEKFGNRCRVIRIAAGHKGFVAKSDMYHLLPAFLKEMEQLQFLPRYDIMHTHYWLSGLLGSQIAEKFGIPWIHTSHSLAAAKQLATGVKEPRRLKAEKMILQSADFIVATAKAEKTLIQSTVKNPSPIGVIPIGVDEAFKPSNAPIRKPLTFTYAGRLEETKGIYTLIQAFKLLVFSGLVEEPMRLRIIGGEDDQVDASYKRALAPRLQAAVSGIEDHVEFLGSRSQYELAEYFGESTAVIVPSYYESFGMVAAEAQSCGVPVIASNVGGLGNIVLHKETGLLTSVGDVKELASAMGLLAKRPDIVERLGQQAAAYARKSFDWTTISQRMDILYKGIRHENKNTYVSH